MMNRLPPWLQHWFDVLLPFGQLLLIILGAWVARRLFRIVLDRLRQRALVPPELVTGLRRTASFLISFTALLLALDLLGVSATVLWTALTGFVAVAAVAFFAAWSVLSNIFCTLLIIMTRPFRLYDHIELLEGGDKPGLRGQVMDVNLIYTTLKETAPLADANTTLQIPNNLFFQRTVRRWRGTPSPELAPAAQPVPATAPLPQQQPPDSANTAQNAPPPG